MDPRTRRRRPGGGVSAGPPVPDPAIPGAAGPGLERDIPLPDPSENGGGSRRLELVRGGGEPSDASAEAAGSRFRLIGDVELADLEPPRWLVGYYLTQGGLSVLYRPPWAEQHCFVLSFSFYHS